MQEGELWSIFREYRKNRKRVSKNRNEITNYKTYTGKKGRKSIDKELEELFSFVF